METMVDREELLEQRVGSLEGKVDEGFQQVDARFGLASAIGIVASNHFF
jgi:hypothetical protein